MPGKVPPHRLRLKVGAKIMVLRNLSPKDRLVNGTTAIVRAIKTTWLRVETADGQHHVIPRINFKIDVKKCGYVVSRRQFPVRLAYAKTIHKAQGSTLESVGLDLRGEPFSHGQLYVAVGRARDGPSVAVLVNPGAWVWL